MEEFLDARRLAACRRGEVELRQALAGLRSRVGFGEHVLAGSFTDASAVAAVLTETMNPITQAFLLPFAPDAEPPTASLFPVEPVVLDRLRKLDGGSPLHLSLVEVMRRRYVAYRKDIDRRDKEAIRAAINADGE